MKMFRKQDGFTLLELLVVISILATIGGAVIASMGQQEENAAQGTATNAIAGLENIVRVYQATNNGQLPNDLEALACIPSGGFADGAIENSATPASATATSSYKLGGSSNLQNVGGGLGKKLADKFDLVAIDDISALSNSGVATVRYAVTELCDETEGSDVAYDSNDGVGSVTVADKKLSEVQIPNLMFDTPYAGKNRGRGISETIANDYPLMVWKRGTNGYNNTKLGCGATDVLVGLGIGKNSTLVGDDSTALISKAPYYGQIGRDKYAHYIALVNIGTDADGDLSSDFSAASTAEVCAIVDARGDFLDEEMAEFTDQKV